MKLVRIVLSILVFVLVLSLLSLQALAQDEAETPALLKQATEAAPTADPNVTWTVGEQTFTSNYPEGFDFTVQITSSAAPIERGRVVWSYAPRSQRSRPAEIDPDTGLLTASFDPRGRDAIPPWVGFTYHWEVTDTAGNAFETEPLEAEYEDNSREWIRTESDDIVVFTQGLPDDVGPMTVEAMAQQRETYRAAWGDLLPYRPRAILFGDSSVWLEWRIGTTNPNVVGVTSDDAGWTAQVAFFGNTTDLAYGTVLHEVAHLYQAAFTLMPAGSWFGEGNATFFELSQQYDYEDGVRAIAMRGELPVLLDGTGPGVSGQTARLGYDIGYTFWKWLTDNYGLEGHRQLIELIDSGTRRNEAIEQVTGMSLADVESAWRIWLGASPVVPTLIPEPTLFTFPTVTPFGQ